MKRILLSFCCAAAWFLSGAQTTDTATHPPTLLADIVRANSVNSGNYKDILASFFRLAVDDIVGTDKKLELTSSIFALRVKTNPSLNLDKNYIANSFSRRANISYALRLDSNYRFNGFSGGFRYAVIDKRDFTASKNFIADVRTAVKSMEEANAKVVEVITARYGETNPDYTGKLLQELDKFLNNNNTTLADLDPELQKIITDVFGTALLPKGPYREYLDRLYDSLVKNYAHRPLVVAGINASTYSDQVLFSNVNLFLDGTGGIYQNNSSRFNIELTGSAKMSFLDDSTTLSRDMQRSYLSGELGFNFVFRNTAKETCFEMKLAAADNYIVSGLYKGEDQQLFTMNSTIRVRLTEAIWIPVDIKYDPVNNNFLGMLNVTSNFDWLGTLLNR
jgi:hypothetical protein